MSPSPTDRSKPGSQRHVLVERTGLPFARRLTGVNWYTSVVFTQELNSSLPSGQARNGLDSSVSGESLGLPWR